MAEEKKRVVVLFPGIGYHCDKPLLYYGGKVAKEDGWEVLRVPYGNFPPKVLGSRERMEESFFLALGQARQLLEEVDWSCYQDIVFVGKSVGTIVAQAYAKEKGLKVGSILLTPLAETFGFPLERAIAFHGTKDPWIDTQTLKEAMEGKACPLYLYEGKNHSLESGEVEDDLRVLTDVVDKMKEFLRES